MADNVILDIPFDEADGSAIAYDLSPGHHHAAVELGRFVPGRFGNCVYFPNEGKAEIIEPVIDFSSDFTFIIWVKSEPNLINSGRCYVNLKFPGENNVKEVALYTKLEYWSNFCITQQGNNIRVYLDGVLKGTVPFTVPMTGFVLLKDDGRSKAGFCSLDGGKAYDYSITNEEIDENIQQTLQPVNFTVANINFKDFGVVVEKMDGVFNMPERKDPLTLNWDDYHGEVVDLIKPVFGVRQIELRCWIKGNSKDDFVSKWFDFKSHFEQSGPVRLKIEAGTKPLLFEVYHKEQLDLEKEKWRDGVNFGRFTLKLREPEPVKRVLKVNGSSCTISLTSQKLVSIYWGDGTRTMNVYGTQTVSHNYPASGEYFVIVAGVIEDISSFSSDAALIWSRI
jgi:hypothetical protein